jgi:hypothetical protein
VIPAKTPSWGQIRQIWVRHERSHPTESGQAPDRVRYRLGEAFGSAVSRAARSVWVPVIVSAIAASAVTRRRLAFWAGRRDDPDRLGVAARHRRGV